MNTTAAKAAASYQAARILMELPLPGLIAYRVKRLSTALKDAAEAHEAGRKATVKEYGVEKPGVPGSFNIPPERVEEFSSKIKEIDDQEVEIHPVPTDTVTVKDLERVELPGRVFEDLEWWLKDA